MDAGLIPENPTEDEAKRVLLDMVSKDACREWIKAHGFDSEKNRRAAIAVTLDEITDLFKQYEEFHILQAKLNSAREAAEHVVKVVYAVRAGEDKQATARALAKHSAKKRRRKR